MTKELMDKAATALASAKLLLEPGETDGATNRAYYAMFEAATASLSLAGFGGSPPAFKSHGGLIGGFCRHLVQPGHLPSELGRSLNRVHELRLTADYIAELVPIDKAKAAIAEAETFVASVQQLLAQPKT